MKILLVVVCVLVSNSLSELAAQDTLPQLITFQYPTHGTTVFVETKEAQDVKLQWMMESSLLNAEGLLGPGLEIRVTVNTVASTSISSQGTVVHGVQPGYVDVVAQVYSAQGQAQSRQERMTFVLWPLGAVSSEPAALPRKPKLSIVYVTKRPGGYDVLLHALAAQTSKDYELIAIDELARYRGLEVQHLAASLGVNLHIVRAGKVRTSSAHTSIHGLGNAWNTGYLESRGEYVTVMNDYSWLPSNFVARTIQFFERNPNAILGYPSTMFMVPEARWNQSAIESNDALWTFDPPIATNPIDFGWERLDPLSFNPLNEPQGEYANTVDGYVHCRQFHCFWDGGAYTAPWHVIERLNGIDEQIIDLGEDAQNNNIADRAAMLGMQQWVDGLAWIPLLAHQAVREDLKWRRDFSRTNLHRWNAAKERMLLGNYPITSPNKFSLGELRAARTRRERVYEPLWSPEEDSEPLPPYLRFFRSFRARADKPLFRMLFMFPGTEARAAKWWKDGLNAAVELLKAEMHISFLFVHGFNQHQKPNLEFPAEVGNFDFVLGVSDFFGIVDYSIGQIKKHYPHVKTGLIVSGMVVGPHEDIHTRYDVVFSETDWYLPTISHHRNARVAFGINSQVFYQKPPMEQKYDVIFVGHLLPWKNPLRILEFPGSRKIAIGEISPIEPIAKVIAQQLRDGGVEVLELFNPNITSVPIDELADYIRQSKLMIFPMEIHGGGERGVLEARSCGTPIDINLYNDKLVSLAHLSPIPTEHDYSKELMDGIRSCFEEKDTGK